MTGQHSFQSLSQLCMAHEDALRIIINVANTDIQGNTEVLKENEHRSTNNQKNVGGATIRNTLFLFDVLSWGHILFIRCCFRKAL